MTDDRVRLDVDPAAPPGTITGVKIEGFPFAVVRHADGWAVFEDRCPHAGCSFVNDGGEVADGATLLCACHGSEFDLRDGSVVLGPATRGLELVTVEEGEEGLSAIVT
jgi:nitrite reductase/ring-hydroxylating ferredoxin subunit